MMICFIVVAELDTHSSASRSSEHTTLGLCRRRQETLSPIEMKGRQPATSQSIHAVGHASIVAWSVQILALQL